MNFRKALSLGPILLAGVLWSATVLGETVSPQSAPAMSAERKSNQQLGDNAVFGSFGLRPPKGYKPLEPEGSEGMRLFAWKGEERADGSSPFVMAVIITAPPGETEMPPLDVVIKKQLAGIERRRTEFSATQAESVKINGVEFLRARWSGTDKETKQKMHGFAYAAVVGHHIVQLSSQDVEPHHEAALPVAEAAVLTFHKR